MLHVRESPMKKYGLKNIEFLCKTGYIMIFRETKSHYTNFSVFEQQIIRLGANEMDNN